jgi:hypothetical protein
VLPCQKKGAQKADLFKEAHHRTRLEESFPAHLSAFQSVVTVRR